MISGKSGDTVGRVAMKKEGEEGRRRTTGKGEVKGSVGELGSLLL